MNQLDAVFNPHKWQCDVLLSNAKRKVCLTGRQSGKTTLLKTIIYASALEHNQEIMVLAPTHGSVKELLWRHFTRSDQPLFPKPLVKYQNNQDMILELVNGTRITFKGTENVDALLGRECDLLVLDEWQSHNPEVWVYLEPLLASRSGNAIFTGTARRGNHIMDFYQKGLDTPDWESFKVTTEESGSPAGSPENIEIAKNSMSEEQFLQEYCCLPMSGEGLVYPSFCEDNIVSDEILSIAKLKGKALHIGVDFNVSMMNAIICVKEGNDLYVVDEIQQKHKDANTHSLVAEIKRRTIGFNVILYPDASGRNRSANTIDPNNTNHQILRAAGYNLVFGGANPPIEDRTILINGKIKPMEGDPSIYVNSKCKNLIFSLQRRTYKNGKPIKDNIVDHGCDCLDYVTWHLFNNSNGFIQRSIHGSNKPKSTLKGLIHGYGTE